MTDNKLPIALLSLLSACPFHVEDFAHSGNVSKYEFPPVQELAEQKGLPDPFLMYDGSRVKTLDDWDKQRDYLKQMLAHYLYGHMPPRPKQIQVESISACEVFGGKAVEEHHKLTISRNGRSLSFRMALIRPLRKQRQPVIVKNCYTFFDPNVFPEGQRGRGTAENDRYAAKRAVQRGYILCKFIRDEVAADRKDNRGTGVFPLYPEYDWGTIAAWAWAHQLVVGCNYYSHITSYKTMTVVEIEQVRIFE